MEAEFSCSLFLDKIRHGCCIIATLESSPGIREGIADVGETGIRVGNIVDMMSLLEGICGYGCTCGAVWDVRYESHIIERDAGAAAGNTDVERGGHRCKGWRDRTIWVYRITSLFYTKSNKLYSIDYVIIFFALNKMKIGYNEYVLYFYIYDKIRKNPPKNLTLRERKSDIYRSARSSSLKDDRYISSYQYP
jgi:hypothetical protein